MLFFNYCVFLPIVLIWSFVMIGIKIRTALKSELNWLHENVHNFNSRCPGSQEMKEATPAVFLLLLKSSITFSDNVSSHVYI